MQGKLKIALLLTAVAAPFAAWMYFHGNEARKTTAEMAVITPPVKEADIPMDVYRFSPDSNVAIKRPTGTRIRIRPGIFVREDGKPVTGAVELNVREFHTAEEILRSGIPMAVNSDKGEFLQSAGMIELQAYNDGSKLQIRQGEGMDIDLAGYRNADGYSLYRLADNADWVVTDSFSPGINRDKAEWKKKAGEVPPKPVFDDDPDAGLVFSLAGNALYAPQLASLADRKWKIRRDYDNPDIKKAMRINWDNISVEPYDRKNNIYDIVLMRTQYVYDGDDLLQTIIIKASPVLDGEKSEADRAFFEAQMKEYNAVMRKIAEEKSRMEKEADLVNSFRAGGMGIYNIDKIYKCDEYQTLPISFDFENEINPKINKVSLFAVYEEQNSVIQYKPGEWNAVYFPANKRMKLIAILPGNKIAVVEYGEIQKQLTAGNKNPMFPTRRQEASSYFNRQPDLVAMK